MEGDPSGLLAAFLALPDQLGASYRGAAEIEGIPVADGVRAAVIAAMGGSAAAGDVAVACAGGSVPVPMITVRGYRLPGFCDRDTLVMCCSYSGGTEETVSVYREAVARGCRVVAVCSGGELASLAEADGVPAVRVPGEVPMPRAALGHLAGAVLGVLSAAGLARVGDIEEAEATVRELAKELSPEAGGGEAWDVASWMGDRIPVIWGSEGVSEPAAWRWKCAFNENAKIPAFASALPELDHHEVVGWAEGGGTGFALVVLREDGEHQSVGPRLAATVEELAGSGLAWREVRGRGGSPLARALSLMLVGDAASTYHALRRGVDPAPIRALERVKLRLAEARR